MEIPVSRGAVRFATARWDPTGLMDIAAYGTIIIGYLDSLLTSRTITPLGLILLTGGNLAWLTMYYRLSMLRSSPRRVAAFASGFIAATTLVVAATLAGMGWDWLLALVTISVVSSLYGWGLALLLSAVVWGLSSSVLLVLAGIPQFAQSQLTMLPAWAFCFFLPRVVRQQHIQRARAEALVAQLEDAQDQLRAYANEVEELAVTRERNRMAREIHDTLGHHLTLLAVKLETALKLDEMRDPRLRDELGEARRVASDCLREVRESVGALRPSDPTASSFAGALERLIGACQEGLDGTEVVLDVEGPAQDLPTEVRIALYRCVQESLTNIRKHARASKVLVRLRVDAREAVLLVRDNGQGASSSEDGHAPGYGMIGMRERFALLGGSLSAAPDPKGGWRVEARIPHGAADLCSLPALRGPSAPSCSAGALGCDLVELRVDAPVARGQLS